MATDITGPRGHNPLGSTGRRSGVSTSLTFTSRKEKIFSSKFPSTRGVKFTSTEMLNDRVFSSEPFFSSKTLEQQALTEEGFRWMLLVVLPIVAILVLMIVALLLVKFVLRRRRKTM